LLTAGNRNNNNDIDNNNDSGNVSGKWRRLEPCFLLPVAILADFRLALHPVLAAINNRQRFPSVNSNWNEFD